MKEVFRGKSGKKMKGKKSFKTSKVARVFLGKIRPKKAVFFAIKGLRNRMGVTPAG
jgi:hypothetical protein